MNRVKLAQAVSVVVGAVVAVTLVSTHPVQVLILGACAGVYILAPKYL